MKSLPLPLRVAAGLVATTAEHVRELPKQVIGLPVTVASQVLQFTMRVQQQVTELAIKGDDALANFRPVEDTPSWAVFDEDVQPDLGFEPTPSADVARYVNVTPIDQAGAGPRQGVGDNTAGAGPRQGVGDNTYSANNGHRPDQVLPEPDDADPWEREERALAEDHREGEFDSTGATDGPGGLANYDELTLPQLRARLRRLSVAQLEELLAYERAHGNRVAFVGMLTRRIGNVQKATRDNGGTGAAGR